MRQRLDQALVDRGLVATRSQAESYIKLGGVIVNGQPASKPAALVAASDKLELTSGESYVSRAGLKLASVASELGLDFWSKIVLDVGSSTGGFTDYALQNGAKNVIAVDVGTNQLHPSLRSNPKVELHEQTDIRDFSTKLALDMIVIDVSFISLTQILPSVARLASRDTQIIAMVKPQFEAIASGLKHKGVIKNEKIRRQILKDFEIWTKSNFVIINKSDSKVAGSKGNLERFYLLKKIS